MSVPREMSQLSVEAFTAGIVEAALDGLGFVSTTPSMFTKFSFFPYSLHE